MIRFYVRVAQLIFCQAGYDKAYALQMAQAMVSDMLDNIEKYRASYQVKDEFDLACHMARAQVVRLRQPAAAD